MVRSRCVSLMVLVGMCCASSGRLWAVSLCSKILMMQWNGLYYYDTASATLGGDECGGSHQMASTMRLHDVGCTSESPPRCKDPITTPPGFLAPMKTNAPTETKK